MAIPCVGMVAMAGASTNRRTRAESGDHYKFCGAVRQRYLACGLPSGHPIFVGWAASIMGPRIYSQHLAWVVGDTMWFCSGAFRGSTDEDTSRNRRHVASRVVDCCGHLTLRDVTPNNRFQATAGGLEVLVRRVGRSPTAPEPGR